MTTYSLEEPIEPQPSPESAFGRYRLAYQLASGGMGTVYLARAAGPAGFEKLVALKRIHPHMATDRRFVSMFLDEARIAAQIQHPNVCSVIDFGEVDGSYFLTMPFILGESMNRVIGTAARASGAVAELLPLVAARLVADACEGLHAAHELRDESGRSRDVVHRDVSPHNLMVGYDGVARVLDFGVASARDRHYQTTTGEVKGKFAYLAPEQIEAQKVDRRADIWALGVVLWEAVTARRLFARESMAATIRCVTTMQVPSVRELAPHAPAALDQVVQKALARDPAERYPTARAMGKDLAQILAREDRFVGSPDVAEWMLELFPDGLQVQERLVEATRTGRVAEPILAPPTSLDQSSVQRREAPPADATAVLDESSYPAAPLASSVSEVSTIVAGSDPAPLASAEPARSRSILPMVAVALGIVAFGVVGIAAGAWWLTRSPPEMVAVELPTTRATMPEAPPPTGGGAQAQEGTEEPVPNAAAADVPPVPANDPVPAAPEQPPQEAPVVLAPEPARAPRAEAPQEASARPRGNGTLTVATPGGWGLVFLGSRSLGEAPGVFTVPAGSHTIQIQPFGRGERIRRRVVVRENGTARVSVPVGG